LLLLAALAVAYLAYVVYQYRRFLQCSAAEARGDLAGAIRAMRALLRAPGIPFAARAKPWARLQLANLLFERGDYADCVREGGAIAALPRRPGLQALAHIVVGNALAAENRLDDALGHGRQALEILGVHRLRALGATGRERDLPFPQAALAHALLAQVFARRGDFDMALAEGNAALELDSDSASARLLLGDIARYRGEWKEAMRHYDRVGIAGPRPPEASPIRGVWLQRQALAHLSKALTQAAQEDFPAALTELQEALSVGARHPAILAYVHLRLAAVLAALGDRRRSRHQLEVAKEFCAALPDHREVQAYRCYNEGLVLAAEDDRKTAVERLQEAIRLVPSGLDLPELYYELGRLQRALGETEPARRSLTRAAEMTPVGEYSRRSRRLLEEESA